MLPVVLEDIIYKYKNDLDYNDVLNELKREIDMFKSYYNQRVTLNEEFSYYLMKKMKWKNKKLKYKKLKEVRCDYCSTTIIPYDIYGSKAQYKHYELEHDYKYSIVSLFQNKNKGCVDCRKASRYYYLLFHDYFYK